MGRSRVAQPLHLFSPRTVRHPGTDRMRPRDALLKLLYERGAEKLASLKCNMNLRFKRDPFQETAVHMLVKGSKVNLRKGLKSRRWFRTEFGSRTMWYMLRGGEEVSDATHESEGELTREHLLPLLDELPYVAVYLGFLGIHTPKELRKLKLQLWETLNAVRYFLWDSHVVFVDAPKDFQWKPNDYVKVMRLEDLCVFDEVVLLDPNAEESLTSHDVLNADVFLFGGIVDKEIPRPGLTSKIPCDCCRRRRIELWGSTVGVPLMIHKLVFAVLMARYELRGDIQKAIIKVMGSRERRWRLAWEAITAYKEGKDPLEAVLRKAEALGASRAEVVRALKMSGIEGGKLAERLQAEHSGEDRH
ncbi:tRNA (guanine-N1-)-methyltransferase [Ignicoccus hospitalis KIN4/I]|uniref:tRNA (Guanine-N1-)-methyltransferase n=2 Tax=Ignicoccus TaxID=54258 RepID=A8AAF1_IGNH4|nr:tRNA (guanine-N1-)-methyltransferase [Ignicoccus hospitalis KIN4/I]